MKIAVIGAGAIGGLVAGYLKDKGEDVSLIGRRDSVELISSQGLEISGVRGRLKINISVSEKLEEKPGLAILAVKTQDIEQALKQNRDFLYDTLILATQNGMQAENILSRSINEGNIISSIIMFGATYIGPSKIMHNFEGKWVVGSMFKGSEDIIMDVSRVLNKIFPVVITDNIRGMKYLKIFLNANNCLPAIIGKSMQETFSDLEICKISLAIWKEGLAIVDKAGIVLASLPDFPVERMRVITSLPLEESAPAFSKIMVNLSKEPLYGSILQSIQRDRPSEIDYLNGEFVRLAHSADAKAPLNEMLVDMVHKVEENKNFLTKEELINQTK